jgi:hypothetical protein
MKRSPLIGSPASVTIVNFEGENPSVFKNKLLGRLIKKRDANRPEHAGEVFENLRKSPLRKVSCFDLGTALLKNRAALSQAPAV